MTNNNKMDKKEIEFLKESNAIEREYSEEALQDSMDAWALAKRYNGKIDIKLITSIHQEVLKSLNPRIAGNIRKCPIYVGTAKNYRECLKPEEINEELRLLCNPGIYPTLSESLIKRWHIQFEKIHPFEDGNGRVGRIIMNIQRLKEKLPLLIIHEGKEQFEYYKWFKEINCGECNGETYVCLDGRICEDCGLKTSKNEDVNNG